MKYSVLGFLIVLLNLIAIEVQGQGYEDRRCRCVCPSLSSVTNKTNDPQHTVLVKKVSSVPPNKCTCEDIILPIYKDKITGKEQEYCPRCECKYEHRNQTIIQVVVIIVIWVISILVIYMAFLIILDPLLNKRIKGSYQEHTNEDDDSTAGPMSHNMSVRGNVLNRVGHQQDKWKRQVKEQRRNIYDRHTMLN
ncbi:uncharacterized protein CG1161 [Aethina tumida]|uniref:uncharacterized protein CG1161 n=1 Tax=Aethina tumida TaxID=116153 RepID=UPI00096B4034|nr:uncharacterized protein CG1161 [Aethina tumida]